MNLITELDIKNFRSIKKLLLANCKQFNLLIGKNNCGKSTLLESVYASCDIPNMPLEQINTCRSNVVRTNEDLSVIFHNIDVSNPVEITRINGEQKRKLDIECVFGNDSKYITMTGQLLNEKRISSFKISIDDFSNKYSVLYNQADWALGKVPFTSDEIESIKKDSGRCPVFYWTAQWNNFNPTAQLESLIISKKKELLLNVLVSVDSSIKDIQLGSNGSIFVDTGLSSLLPLRMVGQGIEKIVGLVSCIATISNGIILIDEFENGLHYTAMDGLWKAVAELCERQNNQIFATTHSYECIDSFTRITSTENSSIFRIERNNFEHKSTYISNEAARNAISKRWEIR